MRRAGVLVLLVAASILSIGAGAWAVSDGHYSYDRQHCSADAESTANEDVAQEGCTNAAVSLEDGAGNEPFFFGFKQTPDGINVDPTDPIVITGTTFDPASGAHVYFGADDNLNTASMTARPSSTTDLATAARSSSTPIRRRLTRGSPRFSAATSPTSSTHPVPVLDAGFGACADGICVALTTIERVGYDGGDSGRRPVATTPGKAMGPGERAPVRRTPRADCGDRIMPVTRTSRTGTTRTVTAPSSPACRSSRIPIPRARRSGRTRCPRCTSARAVSSPAAVRRRRHRRRR